MNDSVPLCSICLAPQCNRIYLSPCFHSFCAICISSWLDVAITCPLCKTPPLKIHWGVDTTLGILHTIIIQSTSQSDKSSTDWKAALTKIAFQDKDKRDALLHDDQIQNDTQENMPSGSIKRKSPEAKETQLAKRSRLRSRSRSRSKSRSRSRSTTPIDSYQYIYDSSSLYEMEPTSSESNEQPIPKADILLELQNTGDQTCHTRREIYALGMEPYPASEYPLAEQVEVADMTFLNQFIQRDLSILTNTGPNLLDPVILAYVCGLFKDLGGGESISSGSGRPRHSSQRKQPAQWSLIEKEVSDWIVIPSTDSMTKLNMAKLFVREMRRVLKKRLKIILWDQRVQYEIVKFE